MPHQMIEYSENLDTKIDIEELVEVMHRTAAQIEAFPVAGLRTRAVARKHYRIADCDETNGFVHVVLRIADGRSLEVRKAAGDKLFKSLCDFLQPLYSSTPLAISFEMQTIDPELRWKQNNLRDYLLQRTARN